jgi:hypothetical protein
LPNTASRDTLRGTSRATGFWDALGTSKDGGNDIVAFLRSYFDESYTSRENDVVVAGYVSTIERWAVFAEQWKQRLEAYQVPYFHMMDFRNGRSRLLRHLSSTQRAQLLAELFDLIHQHVQFGVSCRIKPSEYNAMATASFRSSYGSAYSVAVAMCEYMIEHSLREANSERHTLEIVLDRGHKHTEEALKNLRYFATKRQPPDPLEHYPDAELIGRLESPQITLSKIGDDDKVNSRPLQAADILAHTALRAPFDKVSESLLDLLTAGLPHAVYELTGDVLRGIVDLVQLDEQNRANIRHQIHQISRLAGWGGWKIKTTPGGLLIDSRNPTPVDFDRMMEVFKDDPTISFIPPKSGFRSDEKK